MRQRGAEQGERRGAPARHPRPRGDQREDPGQPEHGPPVQQPRQLRQQDRADGRHRRQGELAHRHEQAGGEQVGRQHQARRRDDEPGDLPREPEHQHQGEVADQLQHQPGGRAERPGRDLAQRVEQDVQARERERRHEQPEDVGAARPPRPPGAGHAATVTARAGRRAGCATKVAHRSADRNFRRRDHLPCLVSPASPIRWSGRTTAREATVVTVLTRQTTSVVFARGPVLAIMRPRRARAAADQRALRRMGSTSSTSWWPVEIT